MKKNPLLQLALQNRAEAPLIKVEAAADAVSVYLKGVISADFGVGADDLRGALQQAGGAPVSLYVNSPGGDAFEGREMQALIAGYSAPVTAIVTGMAASAATIITMAASKVKISKGSRYMIHNGWTIGIGDQHAFQALADLLRGFDAELAAEYAAKTGKPLAQAAAWMNAETWFTADEAVEHGFADEVMSNTQNKAMAAAWNLSAYANAPAPEAPTGPTPAEIAAQAARVLQLNRSRLNALLSQT